MTRARIKKKQNIQDWQMCSNFHSDHKNLICLFKNLVFFMALDKLLAVKRKLVKFQFNTIIARVEKFAEFLVTYFVIIYGSGKWLFFKIYFKGLWFIYEPCNNPNVFWEIFRLLGSKAVSRHHFYCALKLLNTIELVQTCPKLFKLFQRFPQDLEIIK